MLQQTKTYIIIVTFNGMRWLSECLVSTRNYPVIVVDNGSQDGSIHYIKENFPTIVLLEQKENLGFGKANNIGISYALKNGADFVFLLNQDAFLESETINTLMRVSLENPDYGIISPIHLNKYGIELEPVFLYYLKTNNNLITDLLLGNSRSDLYDYKMVNAAAWLLPAKTLEIVGGFHPMFFLYGEDDNYCQRVIYHKLKIGVCSKAFIRHDSGKSYHIEMEKGSKKYFEKFLNQIKVKYANVNTEEYRNVKSLKQYYLKQVLKALLKLKFKEAKLFIKKRDLVKDLDYSNDIIEGRKKTSLYLTS